VLNKKNERADVKNWCILTRGIQAKRCVKKVRWKTRATCPKYVM
jgi:hypothetical protein